MFTVDTNILVYAADADAALHSPARQLVEQWRQGPQDWYTGWNTLYEFARVVTHPKVLRRVWRFAEAWHFCQLLLESPSVRLMQETSRHADAVAELARDLPSLAGNLVHDLHTLALMGEHGVSTIYTCDSAFAQFPSVQAVNPLRPG